MTNKDVCPICEEGHLTHLVDYEDTEYKGEVGTLPLHYSECNACGSEQADAKDVRLNKRAMQAFKKKVDGFLTGAEIVAIREKYGLTQKQAANIFGGGPVAFSKYETDDVIQSEPMNNLLIVCRENVDALISLARKAGELDIMNRLRVSQARKFDHAVFVSTKYSKGWMSRSVGTKLEVAGRVSNVTYLSEPSAA